MKIDCLARFPQKKLQFAIKNVYKKNELIINYEDKRTEIRQSKINSRSVAGSMGQMNRRPSV